MIARGFARALLGLALLTTVAEAQETQAPLPHSREVWAHAHRQEPVGGVPAFGVTLEGIYHFGHRAHDRWRRNTAAEVLSHPLSSVRVELGYDPESALITGAGGFHASAEGTLTFAERLGAGAYARYDRAGSDDAAIVTDLEVGAQFSFWSDERRSFVNEKLGYRRITADDGSGVATGDFLQIRQHLVYIPSEDWGLTFVQEGTLRFGVGEGPHTNELRVENLFLASPSLLYSLGPIVGVDLEYRVGPATSELSVPIGARGEVYLGRLVVALTALYDLPTIEGQRTAGLLLRGSGGFRF